MFEFSGIHPTFLTFPLRLKLPFTIIVALVASGSRFRPRPSLGQREAMLLHTDTYKVFLWHWRCPLKVCIDLELCGVPEISLYQVLPEGPIPVGCVEQRSGRGLNSRARLFNPSVGVKKQRMVSFCSASTVATTVVVTTNISGTLRYARAGPVWRTKMITKKTQGL